MADEQNHLFSMSAPAEIAFPPALHEKRAVKGVKNAEPRWEIALLFDADHPDLPRFKALAKQIAVAKVPGFVPGPDNWSYPWKSADAFIARHQQAQGDKARDNSFMAGKVMVNAHASKYPPRLSLFIPGQGVVDLEGPARDAAKDKFFAGGLVLCEFGLVCYNNNGITVTAYLNHVLSVPGGEKRAGGRPTEEKFSAYIGHPSMHNPLDDQIPF